MQTITQNTTSITAPPVCADVRGAALSMEYSDETLVELFARERCSDALEEIVNRYSDKVMRLALRVTRNETDAQEVLQNVFLTLVEKMGTFRGDSKFSTWLYRVALNAAYMYAGKAGRRSEKEIYIEDYAPYDESGALKGVIEKGWSGRPDEEVLGQEGMDAIESAVKTLPLKYRVVFQLGDVEGLSDRDTADALDLSLSAVKSRKRRARLYLRDKLSDYFYERGHTACVL